MNKKFVYQVGNNKMLYYDARPTKCQDLYLFVLICNMTCNTKQRMSVSGVCIKGAKKCLI
jgi:hypothetical protein